MILGSRQLSSFKELNDFLAERRENLPWDAYAELRLDIGFLLNNVGAAFDHELRQVYISFTRDRDWDSFKKTTAYRDTWTAIEKRADNAKQNKAKYVSTKSVPCSIPWWIARFSLGPM